MKPTSRFHQAPIERLRALCPGIASIAEECSDLSHEITYRWCCGLCEHRGVYRISESALMLHGQEVILLEIMTRYRHTCIDVIIRDSMTKFYEILVVVSRCLVEEFSDPVRVRFSLLELS